MSLERLDMGYGHIYKRNGQSEKDKRTKGQKDNGFRKNITDKRKSVSIRSINK